MARLNISSNATNAMTKMMTPQTNPRLGASVAGSVK